MEIAWLYADVDTGFRVDSRGLCGKFVWQVRFCRTTLVLAWADPRKLHAFALPVQAASRPFIEQRHVCN